MEKFNKNIKTEKIETSQREGINKGREIMAGESYESELERTKENILGTIDIYK